MPAGVMLTPEAQASVQAACQIVRDIDMGKVMAGAADAGKEAMARYPRRF